ncbi:MAG: ribonuclease H family protein [Anaerolineae bacterium]|nr:ribonuclease H family protein [Anaerolineae bacterium]
MGKWYVVWHGRTPGVYSTWEEARQQVEHFPGARYKAFLTREAAQQAFEARSPNDSDLPASQLPVTALPDKVRRGYAVDAACNSITKEMEYRCVRIADKQEVFRRGPFPDATNNVGEFLAIVHALAWLRQQGSTAPVYSDSMIAIFWIAEGKCRTRLPRTDRNAELFERIARAEQWLAENDYCNAVLKWRKDEWGENPADFGR